MKCSRCSAEITVDADTCGVCGATVTPSAPKVAVEYKVFKGSELLEIGERRNGIDEGKSGRSSERRAEKSSAAGTDDRARQGDERQKKILTAIAVPAAVAALAFLLWRFAL